MPDDRQSYKSWRETRRSRREAQRELRAERRARGLRKGDVISDAPWSPDAGHFGAAGGGFGSTPSEKLGRSEPDNSGKLQ